MSIESGWLFAMGYGGSREIGRIVNDIIRRRISFVQIMFNSGTFLLLSGSRSFGG